jgi:hypothetical protein
MNQFTLDNIKKELADIQINWSPTTTIEKYIKNIDISVRCTQETKTKIKNSAKIIGEKMLAPIIFKAGAQGAIFFIKMKDNTEGIYLSLGYCIPLFWYYFDTIEKLNEFMRDDMKYALNETFVHEKHEKHDHDEKDKDHAKLVLEDPEEDHTFTQTYAYLDCNHKMENLPKFEEIFIKSEYTESLLWGSAHTKYPLNRKKVAKSCGYEIVHYIQDAMKQYENYYSVSTRTIYSKSTLRIVTLNGSYYLYVRYRSSSTPHPCIQIINSETRQFFNEDLPVDVIIAMQNYGFIGFLDVLGVFMSKTTKLNNPQLPKTLENAFRILDHLIPQNELEFRDDLLYHIKTICLDLMLKSKKSVNERDDENLNKLLKYYEHLTYIKDQYIINDNMQTKLGH